MASRGLCQAGWGDATTQAAPLQSLQKITFCVTNAMRYYLGMSIQSFASPETEALFQQQRVRRFVNIEVVALRKLRMLHAAHVLADLRVPPGNRLEALSGDRAGQHSIRINDQWRVCFVWSSEGPQDVEIVDYH